MAGGRAAAWVLCVAVGAIAPLGLRAQTVPVSFAEITRATPLENGVELRDGAMLMRITALREDVLRVRAAKDGVLPEDSSWAVLAEARAATVAVTEDSDAASVGFHTAKLRVRVERATGLMTVLDSEGNVLQKDVAPLRFDGEGYRMAEAMPLDEHYFGLGDKTGAFDHRDEAFRMWNTDAYGWQESTDPLYKDIPFYLAYRAGVSIGVLMDNTWPCSFDFGKTRGDVFQYRAGGGPVNMYLLYGPDAKQVLKSYMWLTGPTPLPPLWVLGFQQSRYSYMSQAEVMGIADRLRADRIPADAIYLDIDYQYKNRPFTVNTTTFPDMAGMVAQLHKDMFHVVAITDLHIAYLPNQGYAPFDTGLAGNDFLRNKDGSLYVGPVWPGPSVFPDFFKQQTRAWWGSLYKGFVKDGIDGFWNDMNEPSVFNDIKTIPDSVVYPIDEPGFAKQVAPNREMHNVYGMENSRATQEGMLKLRPDVRPFVLTRASYAGGQRYAATWTGDDTATWNQLRLTTSMLKNLGLSGFSLAGADVGGYAGTPNAEVLTRWIEIGAFQPFYRDHAEKGSGPHEPWANGPAQEAIRRRFIEARYQLLPYLYTVMEENTHTGLPLLRPIFLEFPDAFPDRHPMDVDLLTSGEFMVGPDLLVGAPAFLDEADDYDVKLPSAGWYDYWTGQRVVTEATHVATGGLQPEATGATAEGKPTSGAQTAKSQAAGLQIAEAQVVASVRVARDLGTLPVYVRPGSILPIEPLVESTDEKPNGPLTLRVFPGPDCHGMLYQDDGKTFAYKSGEFLKMSFTCSVGADGAVAVHVGKHEGPYPAWWKQIVVEVNGLGHGRASATVNGRGVALEAKGGAVDVPAPDDGTGIEVVVRE